MTTINQAMDSYNDHPSVASATELGFAAAESKPMQEDHFGGGIPDAIKGALGW